MKRQEYQSIGDVLRQVIDQNNLGSRLDELRAADLWPAIVGDYIASRTMRPFVQKGAMSIRVPDAALRQELTMSTDAIIREFNRIMGKPVILSLRFKS